MKNELKKDVSILGCGWLGKPLATHLIEKGFLVKGSTTTKEKIKDIEALKIQSFLVDISSEETHTEFLNASLLIIAITSKSTHDFKRLITQIEKSTIKNVIFISSSSVYKSNNGIVTETSELQDAPLVDIENLFRNNKKFNTTIIRFSGLFGGKRHPANWFKNGRTIPHPKGFVNMIHREDCIRFIDSIITKKCWNETFNACADHHPTRKEFYTKARLSFGFEIPIFEEIEPVVYKIVSPEKGIKMLDFKYKHNNLLRI